MAAKQAAFTLILSLKSLWLFYFIVVFTHGYFKMVIIILNLAAQRMKIGQVWRKNST